MIVGINNVLPNHGFGHRAGETKEETWARTHGREKKKKKKEKDLAKLNTKNIRKRSVDPPRKGGQSKSEADCNEQGRTNNLQLLTQKQPEERKASWSRWGE